uniref:MOB kinase activator 2 n=1 Tax=Capra hircus TaxID=9925 RepID=A0A8C2PD60_CAPHI
LSWRRGSKAKPNGKKPAAAEEKKVYLEPEYAKSRITDFGFKELVVLPREIDLNEWLRPRFPFAATTFFHHVNLQYSTISEFCTGEACQTMAVCNTQYYWYDERGKKVKCTAPQYVDFVMSSVQKLVTDEDVFPTKYGACPPVLAESRCCVPAGAHPGLPCCTCPRVARSCGQGCVLWVKSPGVLDPRSPCGVPSPHWQQGPCSGATVGQRWVSWPAGTEALLQGPLWTGQHHLAGCRIAGGWCEQPWSWSSPLWAETRGSRRALCLLRLLIVVTRPTPIPCQP